MSDEARMAVIRELARKVWPDFEITVSRTAWTAEIRLDDKRCGVDVAVSVGGPTGRELEAVEAAIRVLARSL